MEEHVKTLQEIVYWNNQLAKAWFLFSIQDRLIVMDNYMRHIGYCYKRLDALGALGVPSD